MLSKRLQALLSVLSVLLALAVAGVAWFAVQMRRSLPQLDGTRAVAGLGAPARIERDALGVPTITAASRADAARALGFLHAQERYFQMDLLRRSSAGELAALFGEAAVGHDQRVRLHRFRHVASESVKRLPAGQRAVLDAYVAGVNAGLAELPARPWEYLVLRTAPEPWNAEDTFLVVHAMWLDLQDSRGVVETTRWALRQALGPGGVDALAPKGDSWDAPLDGSRFDPPELPSLRFKRGDSARGPADHDFVHLGSNSFAVGGAHTAHGGAMLENDMHLGLRLPNIWYRALLDWPVDGGRQRVVGVTLPGVPAVVVGSNGRVAWGFTDAYIDTTDVIFAETDAAAQFQYRTKRGWVDITDTPETIRVKGGDPVPMVVRSTEWGPILGEAVDGRYRVLRWSAHDPAATDLTSLEMETARSVDEAIAISHRAGLPNQNCVMADVDGHVAWTIAGRIPRRVGFDGRLPVSWAYGDRYWDGWLPESEVPVVRDPADGLIWSANQRMIGGAAYEKLGDGGYNRGARAGQIRDGLRALTATGRKLAPADLLSVALDDRAVFLDRWHRLLRETLTDEVVARKSSRRALRDALAGWSGRAAPDSAAYRLVREFRHQVASRALSPMFARAADQYDEFASYRLLNEDTLWRLVSEKPIRLLNPDYPTWEDLLAGAADAVVAEAEAQGVSPAQFTWGRANELRMQHPFSRFLPGIISRFLDMPAAPLAGDENMPRVARPDSGASERLVVAPGREAEGIFHMPGGQGGHPLSPYYRAGHEAWLEGRPAPLLPGPVAHTLTLTPN